MHGVCGAAWADARGRECSLDTSSPTCTCTAPHAWPRRPSSPFSHATGVCARVLLLPVLLLRQRRTARSPRVRSPAQRRDRRLFRLRDAVSTRRHASAFLFPPEQICPALRGPAQQVRRPALGRLCVLWRGRRLRVHGGHVHRLPGGAPPRGQRRHHSAGCWARAVLRGRGRHRARGGHAAAFLCARLAVRPAARGRGGQHGRGARLRRDVRQRRCGRGRDQRRARRRRGGRAHGARATCLGRTDQPPAARHPRLLLAWPLARALRAQPPGGGAGGVAVGAAGAAGGGGRVRGAAAAGAGASVHHTPRRAALRRPRHSAPRPRSRRLARWARS